ncbi:MAG TPA: hypothetical protein P5234_05785 [Thermoanaerobaculaceae bacterium]|nr:hypothetical protein [Thermoanaerobaculaceae bacterium]HRS15747.1 hypothetical protein [Thermoanaerobaculaceae bacterium]
MARSRSSALFLPLVLIAVGGVLLTARWVRIDLAPALLLGVGLAFAVLATLQRSAGALVAGLLLLGAGAGIALGRKALLGIPASNWLFLCLGAAFIAVYLLGLLLRVARHWWPLVPGVALLLLGGAQYVSRVDLVPPGAQAFLQTWWPAALVLLGAVLLIRAIRA